MKMNLSLFQKREVANSEPVQKKKGFKSYQEKNLQGDLKVRDEGFDEAPESFPGNEEQLNEPFISK